MLGDIWACCKDRWDFGSWMFKCFISVLKKQKVYCPVLPLAYSLEITICWERAWCTMWANTNLSEMQHVQRCWMASGRPSLPGGSAQWREQGVLPAVSLAMPCCSQSGGWTGFQRDQAGWGHCEDQLLLRFLPGSAVGLLIRHPRGSPTCWTAGPGMPSKRSVWITLTGQPPWSHRWPLSGHAALPGWRTGSTSHLKWGVNQLS